MSIDVAEDFHKTIKIHAALGSETIREYVIEAVKLRLQGERELNATTIKTLQKSDKGEELNHYNNLNEMYHKLGL